MKLFSELWEISEKIYDDTIKGTPTESILDELKYKIDFYRSVSERDIVDEEKQKIKSHLFGEILMTLTQLSLKDNINSYKALNTAIYYKDIDVLSKKY